MTHSSIVFLVQQLENADVHYDVMMLEYIQYIYNLGPSTPAIALKHLNYLPSIILLFLTLS